MAQVDQSGHRAVDEDQAVPGTRPSCPFPRPAPDLVLVVFHGHFPGVGQFLDERGQVVTGDTGKPGVGQDRAVELDRHSQSMSRLFSGASPAITHQLVNPGAFLLAPNKAIQPPAPS